MPTLEERVRELEQKVAQLSAEKAKATEEKPWWELWSGIFKDDPDFDEAVRLRAEYRKAQPNAADNPEAFEP